MSSSSGNDLSASDGPPIISPGSVTPALLNQYCMCTSELTVPFQASFYSCFKIYIL